jgi:hypothetical protein
MSDVDARTSCGSQFAVGSKWPCVNGYIGITPLTKLQSPLDQGVYINVYVRSENMMFNRATEKYLPKSRIWTESGDVNERSVVPVTCFVLNPSGSDTDHVLEDHYGELPLSFRSLLKRFWTSNTNSLNGNYTASNSKIIVVSDIYPSIEPPMGTASDHTNLWSYLRLAYLGMKGGMRKRLRATGAPVTSGHNVIVQTVEDNSAAPSPFSLTLETILAYNRVSLEGGLQFVPGTNGGIEFGLPFYSRNLYALASNALTYPSGPDMDPRNMTQYQVAWDATGPQTFVTVTEDTSTGEDFTFLRFVSSPPFFMIG